MSIVHGHFHRNAPTAADVAERWDQRVMASITRKVGTLACAIVFCGIALISLPAAIKTGDPIVIVSWVAQTFLQLVLLSIVLGGQEVQNRVADAQTAHISVGIDTALDRLDTTTAGGLKVIADHLVVQDAKLAEISDGIGLPEQR